MDRGFTLPSFAKINWSLRVLGKRPDGYHEVRTELQTVSLHDELSIDSVDGRELLFACDDPQVPQGPANLVVRAAELLRQTFGITLGARLRLKKNIPIQAGLGGGSSNAAVALIGLSRLWKLPVTPDELIDIAAAIGADVPFFLFGGRVLATGTGSTISKLTDLPQQHLLIAIPRASMATSESYRLLDSAALTSRKAETILAGSRRRGQIDDSHQLDLNNDFEPVIFDREPEIGRARNALLRCGAVGALLAGSGSSVFGIFEDLKAQTRALETIEAEAGWRISPCVTISRSEYTRAMNLEEDLRCF